MTNVIPITKCSPNLMWPVSSSSCVMQEHVAMVFSEHTVPYLFKWNFSGFNIRAIMKLVVCLLFVVLHSPRSARWLTPLRGSTCGSTVLSSLLYVHCSFTEFFWDLYSGVCCCFQLIYMFLEYFLVLNVLPASFSYYKGCFQDVFLGFCFFFQNLHRRSVLQPFL